MFNFNQPFDVYQLTDILSALRAKEQVTVEWGKIESSLATLERNEEDADRIHKARTALQYRKSYYHQIKARLAVLEREEKEVGWAGAGHGTIAQHFLSIAEEDLEPEDFFEMVEEAKKRAAEYAFENAKDCNIDREPQPFWTNRGSL